MQIYNWYHSNVTGIHYVHEHMTARIRQQGQDRKESKNRKGSTE
jgi:hypothetical protein